MRTLTLFATVFALSAPQLAMAEGLGCLAARDEFNAHGKCNFNDPKAQTKCQEKGGTEAWQTCNTELDPKK